MNAVTRFAPLVSALFLLAPGVAHADDVRIDEARKKAAALYPPCSKKATDADLKGAKGSHESAKQFLELGRYDKAIASWNDAYNFDCSRPSVFYNLSNAYERNGDRPMTIAVLEIAIDRDPNADKSTVQAKIDNLKAAVLAETKSETKKPDSSKPVTPIVPVAPPPQTTEMQRPFGPVPWITLGIGGAILVSGIPVLIIGRGKVSDAEKACPTHKLCSNATQSLGNTGNTMTGVGAGLIGGGGAIAIASLVWQFAGNAPRAVPKSGAAGLTFVPAVSPSLAGAVVTGSF